MRMSGRPHVSHGRGMSYSVRRYGDFESKEEPMARTPSTMLELGTKLPAFSLPDAVSGRTVSSKEIAGPKGLLVTFICNHCPFVKHVLKEIGRVARDSSG